MSRESKKIEEVLNSLDGLQRAQAPAFFYTRLRARMDNELENARSGLLGRLLTRPALSLSLAAIIVLLNITTITRMWNQDSQYTESSQQTATTDYALATYAVYDEGGLEP
ncbi:MAG: hypothetical protein P0Y53_24635 [Candidatus Pseudobacter hemicellulosilyticus]|uniref:Uncharacterized protein n=1 Tax=Candidatus Pseudobacter hemicellulosilyticus TaxID=3121375 RepID=A0AAJ5WRJ6_9BACT|nr:MAG: hypothetical protein P0Y53_24635 [Pseudobacter sp.]